MANKQQKEIIIDLGLKKHLEINPKYIWGFVGKQINLYSYELVKKVAQSINKKVSRDYFVGAVQNEWLKNPPEMSNNKYIKEFADKWSIK
ncbi:MAG: hypothetical protein R6V04_06105 [bacterium]